MSIRENDLLRAKQEAERFLDRVSVLLELGNATYGTPRVYYGGSYAAAVKRASMDLTKALANLRRQG